MGSIRLRLRHAVRRLRRSPLFTAVCLLTLAVGIGANTAIFSVVDAVLLQPLPYPESDRLVSVNHEAPALAQGMVPHSDVTYLAYREHNRVFEDLAISTGTEVTLTGGDRPRRVPAARATEGLFGILGVEPALGRTFTPEEDEAGGPRVVVLSHGFWASEMGSDPGVLGRALELDGERWEVIGVMPEGFTWQGDETELWLPFRIDRDDLQQGAFSYVGVARLRPGADPAAAKADVDRMIPLQAELYPGPVSVSMLEEVGMTGVVRPLKELVVEDVRDVLWVLLGTVGIVLVIACANVANLFLVRAESREREIAVRTALGAGRRDVAASFLTESVLLSVAGGALGIGLAWAGLAALLRLAPEGLPRVAEIGIDGRALVFTLGISIVAALAFGLFPLLRFRGSRLATSLKEGGRGGDAGRERHRARNGLVVAQVALAMVLLVGSGLMLRTFLALRSVDPGYRSPESVLTFRVGIPAAEEGSSPGAARLHGLLLDRLRAVPGVSAVGAVDNLPLMDNESESGTWLEDHPVPEGGVPPIVETKTVLGDYFATMGIALLEGRAIERRDVDDLSGVVVINRAMARQYWPGRSAVGRRLRQNPEGEWWEVVGVVADVRNEGLDREAEAILYRPGVRRESDGDTAGVRNLTYVVRSEGSVDALVPAVQDAVWSVNPNLPLASIQTMARVQQASLARTAFAMTLLVIAAGVALFLGTVGIYGVVSYVVAQRTREMGVRIALGAGRSTVVRLVLGQGMRLAALGLGVGLLAALGLTRLMASLLFGVAATDPLTYVTVAGVLAAVAALASLVPARRASRVEPVEALRYE